MVECLCFSNLIYWSQTSDHSFRYWDKKKKKKERTQTLGALLIPPPQIPLFSPQVVLTLSQLCLQGTGGLWLWAWWYLSVTPCALGVFCLQLSAPCWFSSAALCFGVSQLQHGHCGCSVFAGVPALVWSVLGCLPQWHTSSPHCAQLRFKGDPEPVFGQSLECCSLQILAGSQQSLLGALHWTRAAPSCSVASLSLHHSPLHTASMPRLVKACQNNPLNPQGKDLIKLFHSGIHAECWTACWMTSSMAYERQCFTEAY